MQGEAGEGKGEKGEWGKEEGEREGERSLLGPIEVPVKGVGGKGEGWEGQ